MPVVFYPITRGVLKMAIEAVPVQSNTLTYSADVLSPIWSNYSEDQLTIGGVTSSTNAGTYTATFTPTRKFKWADGTKGAKEISWTISKATGSVNCVSEITLNAKNEYKVINLTLVGDGEVSVSSNNENVARAAVNNDGVSITIYGVNQTSGSATITVNIAEGMNYTAAGKTILVTAQYLSDTFSENTWEQIVEACQTNNVPPTWSVGSIKDMDVGGLSRKIQIIGRNHDTYSDGGVAPLTFQFYEGLYSKQDAMNALDGYNACGWENSPMRTSILANLKQSMPSNVRNSIRAVNKKTGVGNGKQQLVTTSDYLFLLAEEETVGYVSNTLVSEGNQYAYYAKGGVNTENLLAIRYFDDEDYNQSNGIDTPCIWWLRSPSYEHSDRFCVINKAGAASTRPSDRNAAIIPAFCF